MNTKHNLTYLYAIGVAGSEDVILAHVWDSQK